MCIRNNIFNFSGSICHHGFETNSRNWMRSIQGSNTGQDLRKEFDSIRSTRSEDFIENIGTI